MLSHDSFRLCIICKNESKITAIFLFTPSSRICKFMFKKLWHLLIKLCLFFSLPMQKCRVLIWPFFFPVVSYLLWIWFFFWMICWILLFLLTQFYSLNCINCTSGQPLRSNQYYYQVSLQMNVAKNLVHITSSNVFLKH